MYEFDEENELFWQEHPEVPVLTLAWLYMMLCEHGFDWTAGDA